MHLGGAYRTQRQNPETPAGRLHWWLLIEAQVFDLKKAISFSQVATKPQRCQAFLRESWVLEIDSWRGVTEDRQIELEAPVQSEQAQWKFIRQVFLRASQPIQCEFHSADAGKRTLLRHLYNAFNKRKNRCCIEQRRKKKSEGWEGEPGHTSWPPAFLHSERPGQKDALCRWHLIEIGKHKLRISKTVHRIRIVECLAENEENLENVLSLYCQWHRDLRKPGK